MSETIIQIQHLSKEYRLGAIGTGSFRQDLQRWWTGSVRGQDNAFFGASARSGSSSYIKALDDVSFDIRRGEVWGVVGSNGAGKSTLLKIISRIIRPSAGVIRGKGTISSLLEVGTGFHPELTGRENIYISGYMLGMKKADIQRQFDEIVAFSGIESFIDTPIKRYSSGMYMRLAFAVAAHLDPDILIVDEVLAVGDADFQKKCLGKMQEVSHDKGRTILFVSHNMQAVSHLCQKAVWLRQGRVQAIGETQAVVSTYAGSFQQNRLQQSWATPDSAPGNDCVRVKSVCVMPDQEPGPAGIDVRTPLRVCFTVWNLVDSVRLSASIQLMSATGECIFQVLSPDRLCPAGLLNGECLIPGNLLNDGAYQLSLTLLKDNATVLFQHPECLSFRVDDYRERTQGFGKWPGAVRPALPFTWQPALVGPLYS